MQRADYLIDYLLKESPDIKLKRNAITPQDKFYLYRSLCNVRRANQISDEFLDEERLYLQEINSQKSIVSVDTIKSMDKTYKDNNLANDDKLALWQGDITTLNIGAIVNAANSQGLGCFIPGHNCIDNQIHTYAGVGLRLECDRYMKSINYHLPTGEAFITKAYNLPAEHVIHTVGPIIQQNVTDKQMKLLANCYVNCLELAKKSNVKSVAFCSISTGVFRFPKDLASKIALESVDNYLNENRDCFDKIVFNVYSDRDVDIYEKSIGKN